MWNFATKNTPEKPKLQRRRGMHIYSFSRRKIAGLMDRSAPCVATRNALLRQSRMPGSGWNLHWGAFSLLYFHFPLRINFFTVCGIRLFIKFGWMFHKCTTGHWAKTAAAISAGMSRAQAREDRERARARAREPLTGEQCKLWNDSYWCKIHQYLAEIWPKMH